jgi:hypothetical protein
VGIDETGIRDVFVLIVAVLYFIAAIVEYVGIVALILVSVFGTEVEERVTESEGTD